jgi:hypothetical protein
MLNKWNRTVDSCLWLLFNKWDAFLLYVVVPWSFSLLGRILFNDDDTVICICITVDELWGWF